MSEASGLSLPHVIHWRYRLTTIIQRIIRGRRLPHDSNWFTNVSGNLPFALMSRQQRRACGYGSRYAEAGTAVNMYIPV